MFGVGQMFPGLSGVSGDGFLGIIDSFYYTLYVF